MVDGAGDGQPLGACSGTPTPGVACNDYDECTVDDECVVVETDARQQMGECMGTLAEDLACNDYEECTINDRCVTKRRNIRPADTSRN